MKISFKAAALEFTVTGAQGEVVASHKAENVESSLDLAQLLTNIGSLAQLFGQIDHTITLEREQQGSDAHIAKRQAEAKIDAALNVPEVRLPEAERVPAADAAAYERSARMQAFIDSVKTLLTVAREEQLCTDRFAALAEQADRLMAQPEFVVADLVDISFDLFDAQSTAHFRNDRVSIAMKAMQNARQRRGRDTK